MKSSHENAQTLPDAYRLSGTGGGKLAGMLGKQTKERLTALFTPAQLTRLARAQRLLEEIENAECNQRVPSSPTGNAEVIDVECEQGVR